MNEPNNLVQFPGTQEPKVEETPFQFLTTDIEATQKDFNALSVLPYVELFNERAKIHASIEELESSKAMMDQLGDITQDETSGLVSQMDEAEKRDMQTSITDFYSNYDDSHREGQRIHALLNAMIARFDATNIGKSTTLLSQSMVETIDMKRTSLDNRLKRLQEIQNILDAGNDMKKEDYEKLLKEQEELRRATMNSGLVKKRMDRVRASYDNRYDYSPLFEKLSFPANVLNLFKLFSENGPDEAMKYVESQLSSQFNDPYMSRFRRLVKELLEKSFLADGAANRDSRALDVAIFFMTYWMAKYNEQEYESGKYSYIKTLVMSVYDTENGTYDVAGGVGLLTNSLAMIFVLLVRVMDHEGSSKELYKSYSDAYKVMVEQYKQDVDRFARDNPGAPKHVPGTSFNDYFPDLEMSDLITFVEPSEGDEDETEDEAIDVEDMDGDVTVGEEDEDDTEEESASEDTYNDVASSDSEDQPGPSNESSDSAESSEESESGNSAPIETVPSEKSEMEEKAEGAKESGNVIPDSAASVIRHISN